MTKYQENKFKNFLSDIKDLQRDLNAEEALADFGLWQDRRQELIKKRIAFFNWFKKQIN